MADRMKFPEINKGVSNEDLRFVSEVWALEMLKSGLLATPLDSFHELSADCIMCFSCKEDAEKAAVYQKEVWDIPCKAVKLMRR